MLALICIYIFAPLPDYISLVWHNTIGNQDLTVKKKQYAVSAAEAKCFIIF